MIDDERFMNAALALGRRGLGRTAPNPSVGALVVKDGTIRGRGCTGNGGRPHGEIVALAQAGAAARDATLYVTLEPCSHHGRTPPCCEAIVAAGIARLVYAIGDPNPLVAGAGAAYCARHGLEVLGGICAEAAARDHLGHLTCMTQRRPAVTLKLAETADGYVAGGPHDARLAITGASANGVIHMMRAMHDAIMVGIETVLADDPLMTVRLPGVTAKPLRIVLDSRLRTPSASRLLRTAHDVPVLIITTAAARAERASLLDGMAGVEIAAVQPDASGRLDIGAALGLLAARGLTRIFSEGGPRVGTALIEAGIADDVLIFTAPRPLGGEGVVTLSARAHAALADPARFSLARTRDVGVDKLRHYLKVV